MKFTRVTFSAVGFPDETQWIDNNIAIPDGKAISTALVCELRKKYRVSDPFQRDYYGWEFKITTNNSVNWCVVQRVESWELCIEHKASFWRKLFNRHDITSSKTLLHDIHHVLESDEKFSEIRWFDRDSNNNPNGPGRNNPT